MVTCSISGAQPSGTPPPPRGQHPGQGAAEGWLYCTWPVREGTVSRPRSRVPGLGDPQVASLRHGHDVRGREDAAPAHTSAAGRASALTCLTF